MDIKLNVAYINVLGGVVNKFTRYVPDDEIPDTHTDFYTATDVFNASDGKFLAKL